jgi:hypothetical protein
MLQLQMQGRFQAFKSRLDDAASSRAVFQVANHLSTLEEALSCDLSEHAQVRLKAWQRALKRHEVRTHTA